MSCAWMPSQAPSKTPTIVPTIGFFSRISLLYLSRAWSLDHLLIGMARHALDICAARLLGSIGLVGVCSSDKTQCNIRNEVEEKNADLVQRHAYIRGLIPHHLASRYAPPADSVANRVRSRATILPMAPPDHRVWSPRSLRFSWHSS
jgi:hypothetical protein